MKMRKIDIREIEGFRLGNAENAEAGTGVTVIISEEGAVGGVDVRGGGPATRETDLLRSENTVDRIHAVVLSGGSAFGLEAASGVMRSLAEKGIGFRLDEGIVVPIVPGASLYDLPVGRSDVFPDVEMGREAVENAYAGVFETGNHGAGTGATVGKYLGYGRAMKSGLGTFACGDDFVQVGAIAAVNAVGDVYNGAGNIIAGLRTTDGTAIKGTIRVLKGMLHDESSPDLDLSDIRTIAASEALRSERPASAAGDNAVSSDQTDKEDVSADEKDDIVRAMMRSYEQENSPEAEPAASEEQTETVAPAEAEEPAACETETQEPETAQDEPADLPAEAADEVQEDAEPYVAKHADPEPEYIPEHAAADIEEEFEEPQEEEASYEEPEADAATEEPEATYTAPEEPEEADAVPEEPEEAAAEAEPAATEPQDAEPEPQSDEFVLTEEDKADMGYDIPFNTTISCLITNAILTKSQANKLAQILHDAYARAIKPVHGTLDGDTVFVMSTCRQKVNFDAFAALAADVLQYAVIDGAASAESAYGLPAARDIIHK